MWLKSSFAVNIRKSLHTVVYIGAAIWNLVRRYVGFLHIPTYIAIIWFILIFWTYFVVVSHACMHIHHIYTFPSHQQIPPQYYNLSHYMQLIGRSTTKLNHSTSLMVARDEVWSHVVIQLYIVPLYMLLSVWESFHDTAMYHTCETLNDLYRMCAKNSDYLYAALPHGANCFLLLLGCASVAQVKLATGHSTV